jgi:hypothetical protein
MVPLYPPPDIFINPGSPTQPVFPAEKASFDTYMSFIVQLIIRFHKQPGMAGTAIGKLIDTLTTPCSR